MQAYLQAFQRQSRQMLQLVGPHRVASLALGGGTPTQLPLELLEQLLGLMAEWSILPGTPFSCESSPATASQERLQLLRAAGVTRLSLGVQSFCEAETAAVHRPQPRQTLLAALERIRDCGFPRLNLDLMIGLPGQTLESLTFSLREALRWLPEELYVYPLYVRPFTRLFQEGAASGGDELYQRARDFLLAQGYQARSLRHYSRVEGDDLEYACQRDAMVGLGCGARSYTRALHYSCDYAVGSRGVQRILHSYLATGDFTRASYGTWLDDEEQRRRYVLLSVLCWAGIDPGEYEQRFGRSLAADFPNLLDWQDHGWLSTRPPWRLTPAGVARSDVLAPLLFSPSVREAVLQGAGE
jgi:oxygen-independent coproporphyrinogen-3 oxidase